MEDGLGVAALSLVAGWYLGWAHGLPFVRRRRLSWSVGIFEGRSPFELRPAEGVENPVLSASDVDDVDAEFVADPFLVRTDGRQVWGFRIEELTASTYREEPLRESPVLSPGDADWCSKGMHHMDPHRVEGTRWLAAVDGKGERWEWALPRLTVPMSSPAARGLGAFLRTAGRAVGGDRS